MEPKLKFIITLMAAVLLIIAFIFITTNISRMTGHSISDADGESNLNGFAQCLADKDIVMYGSEYCGHCKTQKQMFGESFQHINYIECSIDENKDKCSGLRGVPAWEIPGQDIKYGTTELEKLSELSECTL